MKVIVAGLPKTGTKTMNAALTLLGYEVYDWLENFWYLGDDWVRQIERGFKEEDVRRMYSDVDAVVDNPACFYWEEIFDAFPDAKVILTIREEKEWYVSFQRQAEALAGDKAFRMLMAITHTGRRLQGFFRTIGFGPPQVSNCRHIGLFKGLKLNHRESVVKMFRRHNREVKSVVPENQLLVYEVKEGWDPLCKFLGVAIPDKPFPHKNKRSAMMDELRKENPVMQRLEREFKISLVCLVSLLAFGAYKAARCITWRDAIKWLPFRSSV